MMPGTEQKTVGIHTLGCRLNQFESDGIIARFLDEEQKYRLANLDSGPDIAIINTCTIMINIITIMMIIKIMIRIRIMMTSS